jgi:pentatricopeptide repeat protein
MWRNLVVAVILLLLAGYGSARLEDVNAKGFEKEELPFFPSGRLLDFVSMGHRTLLADLTWLSAIQYYGKHHIGDRAYPLAEHLFDVTTRVDPQFRSAYIFGGLVMADEAGDLDAARRFFVRGTRSNPEDWILAFHRGFIEYMRGDRLVGALQMTRASRMPGAEGYASRMAAYACSRVGRTELALRLWEEMSVSEDPALRALAEERLRGLRAPAESR